MFKKSKKETEATIAPGIDNDEELDKDASSREINHGEYTSVTKLTLDETEPS